MTLGMKVDMRPLEVRQQEVAEAIQRLPGGVGLKLTEMLSESATRESLKNLVLGVSFGRELWDKYWRVHCDTVESEMDQMFSRSETASAKPKPIF